MMRTTFLSIVFVPAVFAAAQQATQPSPITGSNWQHVQALPTGTSVYLRASHKTVKCMLTSVDADTLTCTNSKAITFQRADIESVKLPHRGRSSFIMAGLGAGVGVGVVKAVASSPAFFDVYGNGTAKSAVYAGGAGMGAILFWPIGYLTDPTRSTIYKAQ